MSENLRIFTIEEIEQESVLWVWKPFVALGKICLVQGNPGVGKSTAVLALAADVTKGTIPGESDITAPADVIYQTAEDGYADTVKPRLQRLGADCSRVHVIDDREYPLSLTDERVEQAIVRTEAKLFIADPLCIAIHKGSYSLKVNMERDPTRKLQITEQTEIISFHNKFIKPNRVATALGKHRSSSSELPLAASLGKRSA